MQTSTAGLMQRLREETLEQHKRAESRPFEQAMVRGSLPREQYAAGLGQRYLIHHALESALDQLAASDPRARQVLHSELYQTQNASADLRFYGIDPAIVRALPATLRMSTLIDDLAQNRPAALLGVYYVFEGSKNGARYIARSVARAYQLTGPDGLRYLDPHGEQQRPLWEAFKQRMDQAGFSNPEMDEMVAAAQATFDCIADLDDELMAAAPRAS